MIFILFIVCERVLGLILLISLVRNLGNNNLQRDLCFGIYSTTFEVFSMNQSNIH